VSCPNDHKVALPNFNALRACVFPSHPYTMELTDELGLYVENDGPFCFVWDAVLSQDLRNAPFIVSVMSEYVERDRNRPSVAIWSICNESAFGREIGRAHV
jgi:beta-galactosidase